MISSSHIWWTVLALKVSLISLDESLEESREETAPTGYLLLFPCVWRAGTALTACAPGDQPLPTAAGRPARSPPPNRLHPPTDAPLDEPEVMVPWCPGTDSRRVRCQQRCETLSLSPKPKPSALSCHTLPPLRPPSSLSAFASSFPPPSPSPSRRHRQQHLDDEGKTMSTPTAVAATSLPSHHYNSSIHYSNYSSPRMLACHPTNPSLYSSSASSNSSRPPYPAHPPAIPPANAPAPAPAPAPPATAPRLPPPLPSPTAYSSSSSHSGFNGTSATSTRHSLQHESTTLAPLISNNNNNHIPNTAQAQPEHAMPTAPTHSGGKRKRESGPNWDEFYKNGLPDEIIVIDDTPEPSPSSQALAAGHTHEVDTSASENGHAAKRQKRHTDREPAPFDPVYHSIGTSNSHQLASPSKSTVSSDRTNSALHTTAATSLGSLSSSNGTNDYETQLGPKRRRTTRQQAANDAKRLEELRRDTFQVYQPPPFPPKKAAEVPVKVITDVSAPLSPFPPLPFALLNPVSLHRTIRLRDATTTTDTTL